MATRKAFDVALAQNGLDPPGCAARVIRGVVCLARCLEQFHRVDESPNAILIDPDLL